MGRKKKEGAIKAGQLQDKLVRYTFIADREQLKELTAEAEANGVTMKQLMFNIISFYLRPSKASRESSPSGGGKHEKTMKKYMAANDSND